MTIIIIVIVVIFKRYTEPSDISRARTDFYHGRVRYILMTERFHYFRR